MWIIFVFAVILALLITAIFAFGFRRTGPWGSIWFFFIILFLVAVVAGEWTMPIGPEFYGLYWIPVVFVTLVIAFLIAAATPPARGIRPIKPRKPFRTRSMPTRKEAADNTDLETEAEPEIDDDTSFAIGAFGWILLIILFLAAIAGFYRFW